MDQDVVVDELRGIGRRYQIKCSDGGTFTIIVHHSGRRDLYLSAGPDETPTVVSLDESEARTVSGALLGELFLRSRMQSVLEDLITDWFELTPRSPGVGRTLQSLRVVEATGMQIVSLVRRDLVIDNPSGHEVLRSGDRLVAVGRRSNLPAFRRLVAGR